MIKWVRKLGRLLAGEKFLAQVQMEKNIQQYGSRDVDKFDLTQPARPLGALEVRGLALGAIIFFRGDFPFKVVPRLRPDWLAAEKEALVEWWDISSPEQGRQELERLLHTGHRQELTQQLKRQPMHWYAIFEANPFLKTRTVGSIAAWDYARIVNVARWCYDFDYLSWEEAWHYIHAANLLARRDFDSWDGFATSFVAGRLMWNPNLDSHAEIATIASFLVESRASPWLDTPWEAYPAAPAADEGAGAAV